MGTLDDAMTMNYPNLFAGYNNDVVPYPIVVAAGNGQLNRGSVLGKILYALGIPAAGANTGNGTLTAVAVGHAAMIGAYTLKCITAAVGGGTFEVIDPNGDRLAEAIVGTPYVGPVKFTLNHGATDFVVGDSFTIPIAVGSEKFNLVNSANVDGSQYAYCVLAHYVDATSADVAAPSYVNGEFSAAALIFGGTDTLDTHQDLMRTRGMIVRTTVPVFTPEANY